MCKICFLLFIQASLIAFLFCYHNFNNETAMNQNWEAFLDTECDFQYQQQPVTRKQAYKTSRKSESLRIFFK